MQSLNIGEETVNDRVLMGLVFQADDLEQQVDDFKSRVYDLARCADLLDETALVSGEEAVPERRPFNVSIVVKALAAILVGSAMLTAGTSPLWSNNYWQQVYLMNRPEVITRIHHDGDRYFVREMERESGVVNRVISSREIPADQVQAEAARILAKID